MNDSNNIGEEDSTEMENQEAQLNYTMSLHIHPTLTDYYANITVFVTLAIFIASLLTLINIAICWTTVSRLRRHLNKPLRWPSIAMVCIYPIISLAALVTILVPYSWFICHTVMHAMFFLGGPIFRTLLFRYVDSEQNYLKEFGTDPVQLNTPPCCCWCICLPMVVPSKAKLSISRYMVWQMPLWQGSIMLIMNILYYRDLQLYRQVVLFFIPFIIVSVVLGAWSLQITLVIMLCKLQYLWLYDQLNAIKMGGEYPINHTIFKQTIINILILVEMILVSMLAQSAYRIPVQVQIDEQQPQTKQHQHQHTSVSYPEMRRF